MGWITYTHASVDARNPQPLGRCDRCGFIYNRAALKWQYDWSGMKETNLGVLVCHRCMDAPQKQLMTLKLHPDPIPIENARPGEYSGMVISSNPAQFATIVPSPLVVESSVAPTLGTIGERSPIVTETSSRPLLTEINVTPNPDPKSGDGGYTQGSTS